MNSPTRLESSQCRSILSGNYAVSANGRTGASISNLSNNLIFYLVSGNDAYVVQTDPA